MFKNLIRLGITFSVAMVAFSSCEHQDFTNDLEDVDRVQVNHISDEMAKVRDYVPRMAVIAHRGSTFWVPEETEAAWRWAREMGADYLEADLQCSKDGVVLALHDDNLSRTTNIEAMYGATVPRTRKQFYMDHYKMTEAQAEAQVKADEASFMPYYAKSYMYEELLKLDAGTWFNDDTPEQARKGFSVRDGGVHQYLSALADLIHYAKVRNWLVRTTVEGNVSIPLPRQAILILTKKVTNWFILSNMLMMTNGKAIRRVFTLSSRSHG